MEPLGHQEIFAQQAIAFKTGAHARQQGLVIADSHQIRQARDVEKARRDRPFAPEPAKAPQKPHRRSRRTLAYPRTQGPAGQATGQPGPRANPAKGQPQAGFGPACQPVRHPGGGKGAPVLQILDSIQRDRPQRHILYGRIDGPGGNAFPKRRHKPRAAPDQMAVRHGLNLRAGCRTTVDIAGAGPARSG